MFERLKEKLKSKRKLNLENLYELVYEIGVHKENVIADYMNKLNQEKFKVMELETKLKKYKDKYELLKESINEKDK